MPPLIAMPSTTVSPTIPVDFSRLPVLAGNVTGLLQEFLTLLTHDIQQNHLSAARIEVRGTADPEEDTTQVLVRLWAHGLSESETRQYQREFGHRVDGWVRRLSEDQKGLFAEKISFQARRAVDA